MSATHRTLRFREDGFEAKCLTCSEWWPLTTEFWQPHHGMQRCRSCWRLYYRLQQAGRCSEVYREAQRQASRERYHTRRPERLAQTRAWKAANAEHVRAYRRAYYLAHRDQELATVAAYRADAHDVILAKKRRAYADGVAKTAGSLAAAVAQ